jgi:hypothetical protein
VLYCRWNIQQVFQKEAFPETEVNENVPLLINPWEKTRPVSHTHAVNYLGSWGSPQGVVKSSLLEQDPLKWFPTPGGPWQCALGS